MCACTFGYILQWAREVTGQLLWSASLSPLYRFHGLNYGCQPWERVPLPRCSSKGLPWTLLTCFFEIFLSSLSYRCKGHYVLLVSAGHFLVLLVGFPHVSNSAWTQSMGVEFSFEVCWVLREGAVTLCTRPFYSSSSRLIWVGIVVPPLSLT